jgi:hypothetical protein
MRRRVPTNAVVLLGYVCVSFAYFGWRLLPHPGRPYIGQGRDPQIFIWSFAWWPHAILHGENPFVTHAIFAPDGLNLTWATSIPGLALAFSPLTRLFGPTASYNVAALLLPALAAFTAYLLCRHLTRSTWASVAGGYLFGFSSYVLGQELGHMHASSVFLLPLIALVTVRFLEGTLDGRGLAWRLGVLFALQLTFSTEILFTTSLALAVALALGFVFVGTSRPRIKAIVRPLTGAYALALLLTSPFVYYALTGFESGSINQPSLFDADLLNFVVPTHQIAILGRWHLSSHFPSNDAERGAYLGLPTLVIVAWFGVRFRRLATTRFLLAALLLSALATLGTSLWVNGQNVAWLPWREVARLPLLNNVLPARFSVFTALLAAVIVALWTARRRGALAIALPALAMFALMPGFWRADYRTTPERWPFFTRSYYKICFPRNENVLVFPYGFWGNSMLWQAESGFWFRMAEGYLQPKPPPYYLTNPVVQELTYTLDNPTPAQILSLARAKHVSRVLSIGIYVHPNGNEMHHFGPVQDLGGVLVSPACGNPPLTASP